MSGAKIGPDTKKRYDSKHQILITIYLKQWILVYNPATGATSPWRRTVGRSSLWRGWSRCQRVWQRNQISKLSSRCELIVCSARNSFDKCCWGCSRASLRTRGRGIDGTSVLQWDDPRQSDSFLLGTVSTRAGRLHSDFFIININWALQSGQQKMSILQVNVKVGILEDVCRLCNSLYSRNMKYIG